MKRFFALILAMSMLMCLCPVTEAATVMKKFYVNPVTGNDSATGSSSKPFLTIERAKVAVREYISKNGGSMTGDIVINLAEGRYELNDYIQLTEDDSGRNGFKIVYQGAGAKKSVISGGKEITGWEETENGLWVADAPQLEFARDLYVNEVPARRAASQKMIKGVANYIGADSYYALSDGFYVNKSQMPKFNNPEDVVFHWTLAWKDYQIAVKDIIDDPNNSERLIVKLENPVWNSIYEIKDLPSTRVRLWPTYDKEFVVENALELLDEPGEFYFDKKIKKLYYLPREKENMANANVIVPVLERVMTVDGRDNYHQISGVAFRNVGFAHATNPIAENSSYVNQQGEFPTCPQAGGNLTPGAIEVNYANNIEFTDCSVWGTELVGIAFYEGVDNSTIKGCSITDTGSAAVAIGTSRNAWNEAPADRSAAANVVYLKRWKASYNYVIDGVNTMAFFNGGSIGNEFEYRSGSASAPINAHMWKNEPWAERDGIKSWVMFDLEREHNLESIRLSFEEDCVGVTASDIERSNFEVLVSNDEDFSEYEVVKTFTNPANDVEEFPVDLAGRYRYLMIRKTKAEPFAIFGVWAYSHDREPLGKLGLCENVSVKNNYIARAGRIHNQAPAVLVQITKGTNVCQNEIVDSAYTGISLGWGWESVNYTAANNVIENNLIDNFGLITDDGGGIYILGNQTNLQIKGNYVKNQGNMYGGIYFDTGSSGATVENNVVENTSNTFMFWNDVNQISRGPIKIRNTYSDMSQVARYAGDAYVDWEDINVFTPDNPPEEAVRIMTTAGLEKAYHGIREDQRPETPWLKGPDMAKCYHRAESASTRALAYISVAENLLANAKFGDLPWQFDYEDYYAIEKALGDIKNSSNRKTDYSNGHILEEYALKDAIEKAYAKIEHPSYDRMVEMCGEYISGADTSGGLGSYPAAAVSALQSVLETETAYMNGTEVQKAVSASRLEEAVSNFESSCIKADLEYVYVQDGDVNVDKENRKITVTVPFGASLGDVEVKTRVSEGATLQNDLSGADFSKAVSVNVKHNASGQTVQWTLEVKQDAVDSVQNLVLDTTADNWINLNPNTVMTTVNYAMTIQPGYEPYIYKKIAGNSVTWKVSVDNSGSNDNLEFIFGGKRKNIEPGVKEKGNSYYKLVLNKQKMTLYNVTDGVQSTLPMSIKYNAGFVYGKPNTVKAVCENNTLKVYVNDAQIMSTSLSGKRSFNGYCGIYNPTQRVKLISSNYQVKLTDVAPNRPVFTSFTSDNNESERMTDGRRDTSWVSNKLTVGGETVISGKYIWALVDLCDEYSIDEIRILTEDNPTYNSRDRQDYKVYVSKTRPETNIPDNTAVSTSGMVEVYSAPSLADGAACAPAENVISVANVEETRGNKYRYVLLQKSNLTSGSSMGHWYWNIQEVQVKTSDEVAENAPIMTNIAKNRPAFGGEVYSDDTYAARWAVDGNIATTHIASDWSSGIRSRLVVDLEGEYPVESVVYTPRYSGSELHGFEIYATNDNLFRDMDLIHKQPKGTAVNYGHLYYEAPEALSGKKYRYIVVQADEGNNNLSVNELKVYTSEAPETNPDETNRAYVTSVNTKVVSNCGESATYPMKNISDTDTATSGLFNTASENGGYFALDLMKPQTVDYVTYAIKGFGMYHYGMEVVAANKADLSDGVVMFSAKNADGTYFCPVTDTDTKGIILFPATAEMEGKTFRYVGVRFPLNKNTNPNLARGGATLLEVYTKGGKLKESLSGITATLDGSTVNVEVNDLLTNGDLTYTAIAAGYDKSGALVDSRTATIKNTKQLLRNTSAIKATMTFDDAELNKDIESVKVMLWENIGESSRPLIPPVDVELNSFNMIESTAEVTSYYYQHGSNLGTNPTGTRFSDNDINTIGGRGQQWDIVWIDLGEEKHLDAVGGIINDTIKVLPNPLVYYVAKDEPGVAIAKSIAENGKFVAPSEWVAVNGEGYLLTKTGRTDLFYELAAPGEYRYVICAAPTADFVNNATLPGLPAYIAEISAYVRGM